MFIYALLACTDPDPKGDDTVASSADDTAATAVDDTAGSTDDTGEGTGAVEILDIQAEVLEEVVTVVRVSWTTAADSSGHVEFGESASYGLDTPVTDIGTEHSVLLLGNPAETEVNFRVVLDDGVVSSNQTITTGVLPNELPELTIQGESPYGGWTVAPIQGTHYAAAILDGQGRYVWYDILETEGNLMRMLLTPDGRHILYCWAGDQQNLENGKVVWVSLDHEERIEYAWPNIDHDMTVLPDGTVSSIVVVPDPDADPFSGNQRSGDKIVELSPDRKTETEIWNAWDALDMEALAAQVGGSNITHANAIDYDVENDLYYVSLKELGSLVKIDRSTGETLWGMNGVLDEFTLQNGYPTDYHHQFDVLDGSIVFFDNGHSSRQYSRLVEFAYDEEAWTQTQTWEYRAEPDIFVATKGDVDRFDDGNTRVVWSTSGMIQDVTPDGEILFQVETELGYVFTFTQQVDDLYGR